MIDAATGVRVRDALPSDNDALVALTADCPMEGDLTMCVDRAPDFFALARLEGRAWRIGVAESTGVVGCVGVSERIAYVDGRVARTAYVGDLKVHPGERGGPCADLLEEYARDTCRTFGGEDVPVLATVLAGNRSMERRVDGRRGLPVLAQFATLNVHAIPLLWRRTERVAGLRVSSARVEDLEEMAGLWSRTAPSRQLAPVLGVDDLHSWIHRAPGLEVHDYLVARRADGRIAGFIGIWDQRSFKQLRVLAYSPRLAVARAVINAVGALAGHALLPPRGGVLGTMSAVHMCVRLQDIDVLRALLVRACSDRRQSDCHFISIALDQKDPLAGALRGMFAQPTPVRACATTPAGRWSGASLGNRPLYYESALV